MAGNFITRTINQLDAPAELAADDRIPVQRGEGPAQAVSVQALFDFLETEGAEVVALATAVGRASLYGVTDAVAGRRFAEISEERDFVSGYHRLGFERLAGAEEFDGWTFARASAGSAQGADGLLQTFAADVPRRTDRGLLIEGAAVQALGFSPSVANATLTNVSVSGGQLDHAGQIMQAVQVIETGNAGLRIEGGGVSFGGGNDTVSCVVKIGSGPTSANTFGLVNTTGNVALAIFSINYDTGDIAFSTGTPETVRVLAENKGPYEWRLEITPLAGIAPGDGLYFYAGFLGGPAEEFDHFYISQVQIETSPFATSHIANETGVPVERAADSLHLAFDQASDFTLPIEVELRDRQTLQTLFSIDDGTADNVLTVARTAAGAIQLTATRNGAALTTSVPGKGGARILKAAIISRGGDTRLCVDGEPPVTIAAARPAGLSRLWLGRTSAGAPLNGYVRRDLVLGRAVSDTEARAMTRRPPALPVADAPLVGHPYQGRFDPNGAGTPIGDYGRLPVTVWGELPCDLLIGELRGPSALMVFKDGREPVRDLAHLGRWVDVDPQTGLCLVGTPDYRTIRWLDPHQAGRQVHRWTLPGGIPGEIYGLSTDGERLVINMAIDDGAEGETWIFALDGNGVPSDAGVEVPGFTGANAIARGLAIDPANANRLWVAAMVMPDGPTGTQGSVRAYNLTTGAKEAEYYGHYPNDIDFLPDGRPVWCDEHLDRIRIRDLDGSVRTLMAGLQVCADYEPVVGSIAANVLARRVVGSDLEAAAVEFAGLKGLYAPNGVAVLSQDTLAIADTDNGRVIVVRITEAGEITILAVIAHLNEPTKVKVIPSL